MKQRNYFITGGCGFIGSNFIRYILNKYPDALVINYDILTYAGNTENLKEFKDDSRYILKQLDVCNFNALNFQIRTFQPDVVVHFAAETHVDRSINSGEDFVKTNVLGTYNVLEACRQNNVPKVIYISTDEIYGSIKKGSSKETDQLMPRNPYSASKASGDLMASAFYNTYKLPVIITRSSNNFGPYQYPEKLIPLFITNLIEGKKVPLYGSGEHIRDWIHVEDNCAGIDAVINKGSIGQVYNIGGGNERTNIEITQEVLKQFGLPWKDWVEKVADRKGHDFRYSLDSSKLKKLGWKPQHKFKEAIRSTVDWYIRNTNWWTPLKK